MRQKPHLPEDSHLSKREREIMDILLEQGQCSAEEVRARLVNPPGNSSVRSTLAKLESRGLISHQEEGLRFVYRVAVEPSESRSSALGRLVRVFYRGSAAEAVAGLLDHASGDLSDEELSELEAAIKRARRDKGQQT